jgi:predicted permease
MSTLINDLRYAFRSFTKNPGFAAAAILSLAIGIGANTSIFSVANALLLHPLPYRDADRLVILWNRSPGLGIEEDWFSTAQYFDIKSGHTGFEQVAIAIGGNDNLTGTGDPLRVGTIRVSSNLLPMLGVHAAMGRLFVAEEDSPGRPGIALLSYGMWAQHYGSDANILGESITVNGQAYEVVGVLPRTFSLPHEVLPTLDGAEQAEILLPLPLGPAAASTRNHEDYNIMGKLKPGVTAQQAQAEMETITARLRHDYPEAYPPNGGLTFSIVPLLDQVVGEVRLALFVLLGSVGFVMLIACANVANLQLSRAVARQKEIGVRMALGAGRRRIVRQLLTESVLLAFCGGTGGVVASWWSMYWIHALGTKSIPRLGGVGIDGRVLLFTILLSLFSGVLFGLAPALRVSRVDLYATLKDAGQGSAGGSAVWGRGNNLRRLLVMAELALSVVLLIGAGLLIRSYARLQQVAPGFNPENVLTFELAMTGHRYDDKQNILNTYNQLWERLEHLPGATAAGGITSLPMSQAAAWTPITIEGRTPPAGEKFINADARIVSGNYFQAMEIPLLRGRFFDQRDTATSPQAIIVDERLANEFWPGQDAIGRRIHLVDMKSSGYWQTVVGVVGRVKHDSLDSNPRVAFYVAHGQFAVRGMTAVLRSSGDPAALASAVKSELKSLDPDLPIFGVRTMGRRIQESLARRRFSMLLLGFFSAVALVLAMIGVYGVMAYLVSQGTREIGIRMALGATQRHILGLIVRQGMMLSLSGVLIGLAGAFLLTRLMQTLLFGVGATDAFTFGAISLLLLVVALVASFIPARRAARIDPIVSLRCE